MALLLLSLSRHSHILNFCPSQVYNLFQRVGYVGHKSQVTGFSHGLSHFALEFQASARNAAGQHAALLVYKLQKEVRVFVVHVLNTVLLEAAVLFAGILLVDLFVGEAHLLVIGQLLPIVSGLSADSFLRCGGARYKLLRACPAP